MDTLRWFRELGLDLLAVLWPTSCVHCGAADRDCCANCLGEVRQLALLRSEQQGMPCFARARYSGPIRALLVAFKHGGRVRFARELGRQLAGPLGAGIACAADPGPPLVVVAPSRPSRTRERGYRHGELLVRHAVRELRAARKVRAVRAVRALRTRRGRLSQVGLTPAQRAENAARITVRRRFRSSVRGREVVLVDDVLTTGATLRAARASLESAGARVVASAVLCVADRGTPEPRKCSGEGVETVSRSGVEFGKGVAVRRTGPPA